MKRVYLLAAVIGLSLAAALQAQDYVLLDRTADDYDRVQIQPDGTLHVYDTISRETNVPVTVLEQERTRYGLGYGGLLIGNSIAAETGRPFEEIVALRQSGRGWGDIARQYNVNVGHVVSRAHRADVVFNPDGSIVNSDAKREQMKAEKFVNGHDARDGKLDGTGPGHSHGHAHVKAAKIGGAAKGNDHGNGKGHGNGHGKGKH
jgi:hypothetical protein